MLLPSLLTMALSTSRPSTSTSSFFFNDTATTDIYTLSLHDALPIFRRGARGGGPRRRGTSPAGATGAPAARREAGDASVRAGTGAGQPVPRAGPHAAAGPRVPAEPAGRVGAARAPLPRLRAGRRRRRGVHGAAAQTAHRPLLTLRPPPHGAPGPLPAERAGGASHLPARRRARPRQDGPVGTRRL